MNGKPGPFRIVRAVNVGSPERELECPPRNYSCDNYETCLTLAAVLNWDSFTCSGCSTEIDQTLIWQAHQTEKKDRVAERICTLPAMNALPGSSASITLIKKAHG